MHLTTDLFSPSQLILHFFLSLLLAHTRCVDTPASGAKFSPDAHKQLLWTYTGRRMDGEDSTGPGSRLGHLKRESWGPRCSEHRLEGVEGSG